MKVIIKCTGSFSLPLKSIQKMQGDLKELSEENYEKLKNNIVKNGFCFPFFIWEKKTKTKTDNMLLDGHQRLTALIVMSEEKIEMPEKFPCIKVMAKTKKQAMSLILAASSNYGTMTKLGLESFMDTSGITFEEVVSDNSFDAIDFNSMNNDYENNDDTSSNDNQINDEEKFLIVLECKNESNQNELFEEFQTRELNCKLMS